MNILLVIHFEKEQYNRLNSVKLESGFTTEDKKIICYTTEGTKITLLDTTN